MSPLAAASASGESCTGGPSRGHSPPTSQASRSQLPRLGGGGFFRLKRFACAAFLPGSCSYPATLSRCQDAASARLSNKSQRERPGGCPLHLSSCSRCHLCSAGQEPVLRLPPLRPKRAFVPRMLVAVEPNRKQELPSLTTVLEVGKQLTGGEGSVIHF